jgi:hypothetical protein
MAFVKSVGKIKASSRPRLMPSRLGLGTSLPMLVNQFAVNIRPEFLHHDGNRAGPDGLLAPACILLLK